MLEMSAADAYHLWEQSPSHHTHTIKVIVVDASTSHVRPDFERMREGAMRVLSHLPAFRRRPGRLPLHLGYPVWIDTPDLDADYHLRRERLPPGADEAALDELVGRIASLPLDCRRPLWQIFLVEGLADGRIAYVTKIHHALADGMASAALVLRTFQDTPDPATIPRPYPAPALPPPSTAALLAFAARREIRRWRGLPALLRRVARALRVSWAWRRSGRPLPPRPFAAAGTRFNRTITPNRVFAHSVLSLAAMKEVKDRFGCTLNDVYLSVVGGAVRGYLAQHGELPREPLTAAVPASVRREGDDPAFGNATSYWFAHVGSHLADPVERLRAVAETTRAARELFEARDPRLPVDWLEHWYLRRLYQDAMPALVRALTRRPSYHIIVSNVRGPSRVLYIDGARVEALYSMGPLTHEQGLNFTAWSYLDDFAVGVHACREHVPDVRALADALPGELAALRRALDGRRARTA